MKFRVEQTSDQCMQWKQENILWISIRLIKENTHTERGNK